MPLAVRSTSAALPYRIVGIEAVKGTVFGMPQDNFIVIPLKTYHLDFGPLIGRRSLYFTATSKSDEGFSDTVEEARFLMRARRKLAPNEKDNFGIVTRMRLPVCAIEFLALSLLWPSRFRLSRSWSAQS
jgi:hypothetical protein